MAMENFFSSASAPSNAVNFFEAAIASGETTWETWGQTDITFAELTDTTFAELS